MTSTLTSSTTPEAAELGSILDDLTLPFMLHLISIVSSLVKVVL